MPGSDISIVVPTYNEARNITPFVKRAEAALAGLDWEIVFVDDNSPDGTADVVRAVSRADDRVRLVLRIADRGLAKASIQGMLSAKGDLLCVMDGDGQHDPEAVKRMIAPIRAGRPDGHSTLKFRPAASTVNDRRDPRKTLSTTRPDQTSWPSRVVSLLATSDRSSGRTTISTASPSANACPA